MNRMMGVTKPDSQRIKTISLALLLAGSLTLIIWVSLGKFWSIQDSQDQIKATIALEQKISQLRSQYLKAKPELLETDLKQADRLLIQNFTHLAQWVQGLQQQGKLLNLQMQYRILKTQQLPATLEGLTVVPMEIQMSPRGERSAYRPYLQFLQTLEHSGTRIDLQEVTITGDGQKATHLTIGLSVWMKQNDSVKL